MPRNRFMLLLLALVVAATVALSGCAKVDESTNKSPVAANTAGKIPVTTSSDEARKEFLQGRDLNEKLLIQDSIQHFDKAISLDPNFAWAELNRAQVSPTGKEFFEHLKKAVSLLDKASNGEKLIILGTEAGANGNAAKQKEYFEQLVAAYPNDERANFALAGYYFGQQEMPQAIQYYKKATELAPTFSSAYNLLGYAYRQNVDYPNAEQAFKKYIELIPCSIARRWQSIQTLSIPTRGLPRLCCTRETRMKRRPSYKRLPTKPEAMRNAAPRCLP